MKKLIGSLFLFGMASFVSAQSISFEKTTIDYGTISAKSDGYRVFTFKNIGDKPLILSKVSASCGCTVPEWSKEPVLPGKTGKIKVGYDTHRVGPFTKSIEVFSNDPKNKRAVLFIKGNIK
ncbi:MAG: DUF1573 domain-containing protein [Flavobacteriaceae bacterium]|nr:DUF1573 domain-containing protein [Flavobacteriaceae bacterium]